MFEEVALAALSSIGTMERTYICVVTYVCRAFWGFAEHFRPQAESLLISLDLMKQKQLMGDQPSDSSSCASLNSLGRSPMTGAGGASRGGARAPRLPSANTRGAYRAAESSGV